LGYWQLAVVVKFRFTALLLDSLKCHVCSEADTARWAIQQQRCEVKFNGWHRYGTQSCDNVSSCYVTHHVIAQWQCKQVALKFCTTFNMWNV